MVQLSLNDAESSRSQCLTKIIFDSIEDSENRVLTFAEFMNLALYEPRYGYYTSTIQSLGASGDYVTAPELGSLFGQCLARKVANILKSNRTTANIYEYGAGSGALAVQLITELHKMGIDNISYYIIEVSAVLAQQQRQRVVDSEVDQLAQIKWCKKLPKGGMNGVVVANEVLDAIPVEIFQSNPSGFRQGYVTESSGHLTLEFHYECRPDFCKSLERLHLPQISEPYISELHCRTEAWIRTIAENLNVGSLLIIDYGFPQHEYYHPDRNTGSLMCHRRHHNLRDPFAFLGCQDITAHVNFTLVALVAIESGLQVNGFSTLGGFLVDLGITDIDLQNYASNDRHRVVRELNMLTSPAEMGELFKVIELTKNLSSGSLGFSTFDHLHRLHCG